jgi:hypothetical protein
MPAFFEVRCFALYSPHYAHIRAPAHEFGGSDENGRLRLSVDFHIALKAIDLASVSVPTHFEIHYA